MWGTRPARIARSADAAAAVKPPAFGVLDRPRTEASAGRAVPRLSRHAARAGHRAFHSRVRSRPEMYLGSASCPAFTSAATVNPTSGVEWERATKVPSQDGMSMAEHRLDEPADQRRGRARPERELVGQDRPFPRGFQGSHMAPQTHAQHRRLLDE